ncbi:transmembrane protein 132C isoform X2 [Cololabis saira]|nr:transmembrane protein 132C isoform X2 [Cololabis saira]XP_061580285.1 transmembrane protein 132C isoform X2 [Cololabis saira]
MLPWPSQAPTPVLQASFGPYSVTQLVSEPFLLSSPSVHASPLSENVEREMDEAGVERFRVRVLFHKRDDIGTQGTCITLHAFKETEQRKASCIPQHPLGLCLVTLTLPGDWLRDQDPLTDQSQKDWHKRYDTVHRHRWAPTQQRGHHRHGNTASLRSQPKFKTTRVDALRGLGAQRDQSRNQIQLYYSSFSADADLKMTQERCVEDSGTQSQRQLFHIKAVTLREEQEDGGTDGRRIEQACLNGQQVEVLNVDRHVVVRYHRGPVLTGQPIRVSVNLRANITSHFAVIRMKVRRGLVSTVAQRAPDSDPWAVTVERSQSFKHDVISIFCHKRTTKQHYSPSLLQQVACLSVDGLRRSFDVAMTVSAHWWVEYSGHGKHLSPRGTEASMFSFADRHILGIVPITETNTIINTAILTNQPVSLPVTVLAMSHGEKVSDVTSAVTCRSGNENTVKVSSDCSTIFVDGSESGLGSTCAKVEFNLGMLSGSVCLKVWAPAVPLRVLLGDPVLNAIDGWNFFTEEGCVPVYQRSSVHILTQFTAQDVHGKTVQLLGTSDWFVDVTDLVQSWLRVDDPGVASLGPHNVLIGLRPGKTSLHVVSEQWDGVLGRCEVIVTSDTVIPGDLSVQVVSGLSMSVKANPAHSSIITTTVTAHNILHNHHQEASVSVWIQFSDDSASLLSSFGDLPHFLRLSSLAETVVVVTPSPGQRIFAQGDGGGPLLQAELLVSACTEHLITSNSISDAERAWMDSEGGRSTRRLARGSGWIRVNLNSDVLRPVGKKYDEVEGFGFDISDMLVDSDADFYTSNEDEGGNVSSGSMGEDKGRGERTNRRWNKLSDRWMVSQGALEKAVLSPSLEKNFFPGQEKEAEPGGEKKERERGLPELGIGLGVVFSLLALCAVLFLANCLPGTLRAGRRTRPGPEREARLEEPASEGREDQDLEEEATERQDEVKHIQEENEVEIIC